MENLNKENFWNDLHKKHPQAVDKFCKWIDEYKKRVGWDQLFMNEYFTGKAEKRIPQIKFHDIPLEMQLGILGQFFIEMEMFNGDYSVQSAKEHACHAFAHIQAKIDTVLFGKPKKVTASE